MFISHHFKDKSYLKLYQWNKKAKLNSFPIFPTKIVIIKE